MHASYNTDLPNCLEYLRSIGLGPQTNHHSKCLQLQLSLAPGMRRLADT
jgi:hypothetical protein